MGSKEGPRHGLKCALQPWASRLTSPNILSAVEPSFMLINCFAYFRKAVCFECWGSTEEEEAVRGGGDTMSINKSMVPVLFKNPGKHRGPAVMPQLHKECRWLANMLQESKSHSLELDKKFRLRRP